MIAHPKNVYKYPCYSDRIPSTNQLARNSMSTNAMQVIKKAVPYPVLWFPFMKLASPTPTDITNAIIVNGNGIFRAAIALHCIDVLSLK